ncbi:MAG: hypothetical protein ACR2FN_15050 [Chitinophagaceae bacterium]
MQKGIFLCIFIFVTYLLNAQPCNSASGLQKIYWNKGIPNLQVDKILQDKNGNILLGGGITIPITVNSARTPVFLIKANPNGTLLWEKIFNRLEFDIFLDINLTNDGGYILSFEINDGGVGPSPVVKLDSNGNVQWSVAITNYRSSSSIHAIQLANGGFIAAGELDFGFQGLANLIICLDRQGKLLWSKVFSETNYASNIRNFLELPNGQLLVFGEIITEPRPPYNGYVNYYLRKLDLNTGNEIWTKFYATQNSVQPVYAITSHQLSDGSFHFHLGPLINGQSSNAYYHFDSSGNFLDSKKLESGFLNFYYTGTNYQNEEFFYGTQTGAAPILFKVANNAVVWAQQFKSNASFGELGELTTSSMANNGFLLGGEFLTHKFSTTNVEDEVQSYLIKTDSLGKTNCSDTFSTPITITNGSQLFLFNGSWTNSPGVELANVQIDVQNFLPQQITDCAPTSLCCTDTLLYNSAAFCNSINSYTLPDGTVVNKAGIYPTDFKTTKGCDSVIFTSLIQTSEPKIFLGNDTCLTDNTPFIIRIAHDSLTHFLWQDGSTDSSYTITTPGIYWAKATSICGTSADSIQV